MDTLIDFKIKHLQSFAPENKSVWFLSSQHGQLLGQNWWDSPTFVKEVDNAKPWQSGGCKVMAVPWCECSHFFLLVAILDIQPILYVLESIGGYPEPSGAEFLRRFLVEKRLQCGGPQVSFKTIIPCVPKQVRGSNDCGVYLMEFSSKLLMDPEEFVKKAAENSLSDWFSSESVSGRRKELSELLRNLGEEQRKLGGVLEDEGQLMLPNIGFQKMFLNQKPSDLSDEFEIDTDLQSMKQ